MTDEERFTWGRVAHRLAIGLENRIDRARRLLGGGGAERPILIAAYRGYGTEHELLVRGRVLRDPGLAPARPDDSWWRNLVATYRRMESDEVAHARVEASLGDAVAHTTSDEEGHFQTRLTLDRPLEGQGLWHHAELRLVHDRNTEVRARAPLLVPPPEARFGVISDLDDTVIRTNATSLWRMLHATMFRNAHTRMAFPGVAAFFRALHHGDGDGRPRNPLFFVSSSPWNLYDVLTHFLELNDIPAGPLTLRDWGLGSRGGSLGQHRSHKLAAIRRIMATYPRLPFILIGDSGQEDPEIYRDVIHEHPGRVLAAYIRDVSADPLRSDKIRELAEEVRHAHSALVLADDTADAALHAAEHGWIRGEELPRVSGEAVQDRADARAQGEDTPHRAPVVVED